MKEKKRKKYIRFVTVILNALKRAHVRRFPHKHDPKKYGVWTNVALLALKQLEDKSYRWIVELVDEMSTLLTALQIPYAPHWTTLHKAARRIRGSVIEALVARIVQQPRTRRSGQALMPQDCN